MKWCAFLAILLLLFGPVGLPLVFVVNIFQKQYWFIANDAAPVVTELNREGYEIVDHLDIKDKVTILNVSLFVLNSAFCLLTIILLGMFAFNGIVPSPLWVGIDCLLIWAGFAVSCALQYFYSSPDTTYIFRTRGAATGKLEQPFTFLLNPILVVLEGFLALTTLGAIAYKWWYKKDEPQLENTLPV